MRCGCVMVRFRKRASGSKQSQGWPGRRASHLQPWWAGHQQAPAGWCWPGSLHCADHSLSESNTSSWKLESSRQQLNDSLLLSKLLELQSCCVTSQPQHGTPPNNTVPHRGFIPDAHHQHIQPSMSACPNTKPACKCTPNTHHWHSHSQHVGHLIHSHVPPSHVLYSIQLPVQCLQVGLHILQARHARCGTLIELFDHIQVSSMGTR